MSREVLTRPAAPPDHTAAYGSDPDQVVDLWAPRRGLGPGAPAGDAASAKAPLVVVIHGGFWRAAYDRLHSRPMANALAEAGYAVAVPEYRRVGSPGGGGWPGTFDDTAAMLDAVGGLAAVVGADPRRTVWIGHSAGGHLALWAAARHRLPAESPWHAAAASTGPTGAGGPASAGGTAGSAGLTGPAGAGDPADSAGLTGLVGTVGVVSLAGCNSLRLGAEWGVGDGAVPGLLGGMPDRFPDRYAAADPAALLPLGVPVTLVHGTEDQQVRAEMNRRYAKAASDAGDVVTYVELADTDHFDLIDPLSAAWPHVLAAIAAAMPEPKP
jgi:acetyl esterase/lipase